MVTREQERARARRRHDRVQAKAAEQAQRRAKQQRTVLLVSLATLALVLAAVLVLPRLAGSSDEDNVPDAAGAPTSGLHCSPAPAAQTKPKQFPAAPDPATVKGKTLVATLTTNCGDIVIELDGTKAPQTVASFAFLAKQGYFDPSPCHRLTTQAIFVLQCGDPTGVGTGTPGYGFGLENVPANGQYPKGTVAMARTNDPKSNGSQFFIVYDHTALPTSGGGYSIFGTVTRGLDMVGSIAAAGSSAGADGPPKTPISILKVSVTDKKAQP
ncbi:hypothetical protein GCM10025862_18440 [Arsenicicoccus piscis]|uniref:PPIase cyclophilin-type domain-containing protein n=1 Tax=Arsenicicoccus piscis TaxID=673954 RepID=A0ABQ6HQ78_9MICO|nr:hypothetical protein GCM10025862_18440 [Arsenicicoccus piscis]